jgi:hypothetical protein
MPDERPAALRIQRTADGTDEVFPDGKASSGRGRLSTANCRESSGSSDAAIEVGRRDLPPGLLLGGHLVRRHVHLRHVLRSDDRRRIDSSHRGAELVSTARARAIEAFFDFAGATRAGENLSGQLNEVHRPMVAGLSGAKLDQWSLCSGRDETARLSPRCGGSGAASFGPRSRFRALRSVCSPVVGRVSRRG